MATLHHTAAKSGYSVKVEYDGCPDEKATFTGTYEQCLAFMRKRRAPKQCDWALISHETGRCVSYVI